MPMDLKRIDKKEIKILWFHDVLNDKVPSNGILSYEDKEYYFNCIKYETLSETLDSVVYNPQNQGIEDVDVDDFIVWYYMFALEKEEYDVLYKRRVYFEFCKKDMKTLHKYYENYGDKLENTLNLKSSKIIGFFRLHKEDIDKLYNT